MLADFSNLCLLLIGCSVPDQRSEIMDEELLELQRQLEFAQQVKSSIRLSERNVVELVQKLHELRIIDFDLLHTVSGKEYITPVTFSLHPLCLVSNK